MSTVDLAALRALAEAARPRLGSCCYEAGKPECRCLLVPVRIEADDLLALLDRVEAAEGAVERAKHDCGRSVASAYSTGLADARRQIVERLASDEVRETVATVFNDRTGGHMGAESWRDCATAALTAVTAALREGQP